jgi:hypothetical protein
VVFLSYRRLRTAEYIAGRVVEVVSKEFGDGAIFRDLATISADQDADQASRQQLRDDPDFTPDVQRIIESIWAAVIQGGRWDQVIEGGRGQDDHMSRPRPEPSQPSWAQLLSVLMRGWAEAGNVVVNRSRARSNTAGTDGPLSSSPLG